jgi:hypothetical protein
MTQSFEALCARAADIHASIRLEPMRDSQTGNLMIRAIVHGAQSSDPNSGGVYLVVGSMALQQPEPDALLRAP